MTHLQVNNMKGRLQDVLPIGQRHMPDPMSNQFPLIPHSLDQMVGRLQGNVIGALTPWTLKDVGGMPRYGFEKFQDIDQGLSKGNQMVLPR